MSSSLKPMLACKDAKSIRLPALLSPKIDGIRVLVRDGVALSRKLLPIPNLFLQRELAKPELHGFDGEVTVGPPHGHDVMRRSMAIMRVHGEPDFTYYAFDSWLNPDAPFMGRRGSILHIEHARVLHLHQTLVTTQDELDAFELECLDQGYEGAMARSPDGRYKFGTSTKTEGYLTKIKRFEDAEAVIIGFEELMHNDNEATVDEVGRTKRSSLKENKRPGGVLGKFICQTPEGVEFRVGGGIKAKDRIEFWNNRESLLGYYVKYKHFAVTGVKDKPRMGSFICLRDPIDVGNPA